MIQAARSIGKNWDSAKVSVEKISSLVLDWNLYPRREVDQRVVANYAKALESGCVFPNVKVGVLAKKKIIVDGYHRINSRKLLGIDYVDCAILPFESEAALFAEAVRLNADHGKNFSDEDLKANIQRLRKYKFNVKDIETLIHVPAAEIHKESAAPVTVLTSPSGRKIPCYDPPSKRDCDVPELVQFKNALKLCCSWAESGRIPIDNSTVKDLVIQTCLALGKVRFNA